MKIYISGSITNNPHYMEQFAEKEKELTSQGHEVINPARTNATLPKSTTWAQYMDVCMVLLEQCDAIYMLQGWMQSKGAREEYWSAMESGKQIIEES